MSSTQENNPIVQAPSQQVVMQQMALVERGRYDLRLIPGITDSRIQDLFWPLYTHFGSVGSRFLDGRATC